MPTSLSQVPHLGNEEKESPRQAQGTRAHLPGTAGQWPKHRQTPHANPRAQAGCRPQPRAIEACTEASLCRPFPGKERSRMGGEPQMDPGSGGREGDLLKNGETPTPAVRREPLAVYGGGGGGVHACVFTGQLPRSQWLFFREELASESPSLCLHCRLVGVCNSPVPVCVGLYVLLCPQSPRASVYLTVSDHTAKGWLAGSGGHEKGCECPRTCFRQQGVQVCPRVCV